MKKTKKEPWFRTDDGTYSRRARPRVPSKARRAAVAEVTGPFEATCALCGRHTVVAVDVSIVRETGLCGWCENYAAGRVDHVILYRPPTVDEVVARYRAGYGLTRIEAGVLVPAYEDAMLQTGTARQLRSDAKVRRMIA